ncbi:interleukin-1 receptor-associated kinase 1 isoform 4-T4 [Polymixia lowei]
MSGRCGSEFLYQLSASVLVTFCRVMDALNDTDWRRFASEVLSDQADVRLAERKDNRTDWVMNQWESRNGRVGELIDLLERLQLLRARDIILGWRPGVNSTPPPSVPEPRPSPVCPFQFDPAPKQPLDAPSPSLPTKPLTTYRGGGGGGGGGGGEVRPLPRPGPPPSSLHSGLHQPPVPGSMSVCSSGVMCWSYEEVHAGTKGFCPALQVGEGGFGTVYRACMRNTQYAVKVLKQDSPLDWSLVKESFKTEVEQLSQYRHPNIVDLLGYSIAGGDGSYCLIYGYMTNGSLEDQLHSTSGAPSWLQRVNVLEGTSRALQFLHDPRPPHPPLIHGDVKSSNILLDQHLVPKLGDFGLARFCRGSAGKTAGKTSCVGLTVTVRGTLPYLPDEYIMNGELGTALDVYSFGVVLLEVLTGRRALETDGQSRTIYLKDLPQNHLSEDEDGTRGRSGVSQNRTRSLADQICRSHLDPSLRSPASQHSGGAAGCLDLFALACRCLGRKKKRPPMTEVFGKLQNLHNMLREATSCSSSSGTSPLPPPPPPPPPQSHPRLPCSVESSMSALSQALPKLGPLEDTFHCTMLSSSSSSSSSTSSLSSSSSFPLSSSHASLSSSLPPPPSSSSSSVFLAGPCESDESQGYSQYGPHSRLSGATGNQYRSLSPSTRHLYDSPSSHSLPTESQYHSPHVPSRHQYTFPPQPSSTSDSHKSGFPGTAPSSGGAPVGTAGTYIKGSTGAVPGPNTRLCTGAGASAGPGALDHAGATQGACPGARTGSAAGAFQGNYHGASPGSSGTCPAAHRGPFQGTYSGIYSTQGSHGSSQGSSSSCPSHAGSLRSISPGPAAVQMNPSKQRLMAKTILYEEGRIHTPQLLSSDDLYGERSCEEMRGPEESNELDYLPAQHNH